MRLIDADALLKKLNEEKIPFNSDINSFIISAPTVEPEGKWVILTPDYLRGFYDGVTHKDTPAADACKHVYTQTELKKAARLLHEYCQKRTNCRGCQFDGIDTGLCRIGDYTTPERWEVI